MKGVLLLQPWLKEVLNISFSFWNNNNNMDVMDIIPISWIINQRGTFQKYCGCVHRRKRLVRRLRKPCFRRFVNMSWVNRDRGLFDEFLRNAKKLETKLERRQSFGRKEKPNEPAVIVMSNSNYQFRKTLVWCRKRLSYKRYKHWPFWKRVMQ